jgi:hypothetical protein
MTVPSEWRYDHNLGPLRIWRVDDKWSTQWSVRVEMGPFGVGCTTYQHRSANPTLGNRWVVHPSLVIDLPARKEVTP